MPHLPDGGQRRLPESALLQVHCPVSFFVSLLAECCAVPCCKLKQLRWWLRVWPHANASYLVMVHQVPGTWYTTA